jgi:uncharacterized membrane protein (DUF485 family)
MIRTLVAKKLRFIGLLTAISLTSFVGLTVLAGFARPFMATKALGPINIGFVLIAANYLIAWVLALVYVRFANSTCDPLVARITAALWVFSDLSSRLHSASPIGPRSGRAPPATSMPPAAP